MPLPALDAEEDEAAPGEVAICPPGLVVEGTVATWGIANGSRGHCLAFIFGLYLEDGVAVEVLDPYFAHHLDVGAEFVRLCALRQNVRELDVVMRHGGRESEAKLGELADFAAGPGPE